MLAARLLAVEQIGSPARRNGPGFTDEHVCAASGATASSAPQRRVYRRAAEIGPTLSRCHLPRPTPAYFFFPPLAAVVALSFFGFFASFFCTLLPFAILISPFVSLPHVAIIPTLFVAPEQPPDDHADDSREAGEPNCIQ